MHSGDDQKSRTLRTGVGRSVTTSTSDAERVREALALNRRSSLWTSHARLGGLLPPAGRQDQDPWAVLRGRQYPSGSRSANGGLIRTDSGKHCDARPHFDQKVPPGGYGWWYIDAISKDGRHGLTLIAFIGSVFSPYYKKSGRIDPENHSCINVALYGPKARWTMTEHAKKSVLRDEDNLTIGSSHVRWKGSHLEIDIVEQDKRLFNPFRRQVKGKLRVYPEMANSSAFALDPAAKHIWHCLSPHAKVEVEMTAPSLSWSGSGYLDSNFGSESLEEGFRVWHWSRAHIGDEAVVCYEGIRRDGSGFASALKFTGSGKAEDISLPMVAPLPNSKWQLTRRTRSDQGNAKVAATWEDTPFYSRSILKSKINGHHVTAVQESLDMDRFASKIVQFMLPYRMPRVRT
jgi:carotenoid 1,2-hydratase